MRRSDGTEHIISYFLNGMADLVRRRGRPAKLSTTLDAKTARYCRRRNRTLQKKAMEPVPLSRKSIGILKKETITSGKKNMNHVTLGILANT